MPIFRKHDDAPRERTPEERERARAERAARRAARSGTAELPPDLADEPRGAEPRAPAPPPAEPHDLEPPEPRDFEPPEPRDVEPPEPRDLERPEPRDVEPPEPRDFEPEPEPPDFDFPDEPPRAEPRSSAPARGFADELPPLPPPPPPVPGTHDFEAAEPRRFERAESHDVEPPAGEHDVAPQDDFALADDFAPAAEQPDFAPRAEDPPLQPTAPFDPLAPPSEEFGAVDPPSEEFAAARAEPELGVAPPEPELEPGVASPESEPGVASPEPEGAHAAPSEADSPRAPIVPPAARRRRSGRGEKPVAPKPITGRRLPPTPPPPGTPAFSQRRRRRGRILATLVLLIFAAFLFGLNMLFQPFKGEGTETVTVRIPPNSTVADVGDLLADNEIVDSSLLFVIRARLAGADLKAGTYRLKKDSSYGDALDALGDDPAAPRTVRVVIPEGRSRNETGPIVRDAGLSGDYAKASASSKGFKPRKYGAPKGTKTLEGFLFPATYELAPGADASKLVAQQLDAFEQNIRKVDMKRAKRRNLTVYDVLIIASMVEREATLAKERPLIAAVIHNRLRAGEPLGIDATIRYAVRNWSEPLKQSELNIDSPYNTRRRAGLPPTPIGSPGLDSIRAAANPADVPYKYYVVKPNGNGSHNFSSTIEEFERDVAAYNEERERRGGKSPADSG